jgi:hypothetical protein
MPLSPAERQARSDRAKRMHAEGKLGSKAVQRRAAQRAAELRTVRANERASRIAQEIFERHRDAVERALVDGLKNGSPATRVRAAETLVKLALRGESIDTSAAKVQHEARSRDELIALLTEKLSTGPTGHIIRQQIERNGHADDVIDGSDLAVEIAS